MKSGILINSYRAPLEECLPLAAAAGVDGIQLYAKGPFYNLLKWTPEELDRLRRTAATHQLEISALCAELGGHGFQIARDNPARIETTKRIIDIAGRLGAGVITTHIGVIPEQESDPRYPVMLEAMKTLGDYAQQRGIAIGIETGPEAAEVLVRFLEQTAGGVGVNFDPANLVMVRNDDPVRAAAVFGSHVVYSHFKDGVHYRDCDPARVYQAFAEGGFEQLVAETGTLFAEVPPGSGSVDFPACLAELERHGYDGYLTIERETGSDPQADILAAVTYLKQLIKEK